jgi:DnaJ-class molecular chaperone
MPTELTAANGAKAALMGEFSESYRVMCDCCMGTGGDDEGDCETCEGEGDLTHQVTIKWDTIKDIYRKAVEVCGKEIGA